MLTRPLNDFRCLILLLHVVLERILSTDAVALAGQFQSTDAYAAHVRLKPQLDDAPGVLCEAPRIGCVPSQRLRWNADNPNCFERTADYLTIAEILDPDTPRTAATLRVGGQVHTFPVEYGTDGPMPVILDPMTPDGESDAESDAEKPGIPANLPFATVARLVGYGDGPSPMATPLAWAEAVAAREGVQPRNSRDLMALAERYADVYPGGRQGLAQLAGQLVRPVRKAGKVAGQVISAGAKEVKKHPRLGQLLRSAIVGYGGPFGVIAIDVVENRLNKRGYSLGSMADSHDADVFAIR